MDIPFEDCLVRTLCFYSEPPNGGEPEYIAETASEPGKRNYKHHKAQVIIRDIRDRESIFLLDSHAFTALPNAYIAGLKDSIDFEHDESVRAHYLPAVEAFILKNVPGAEKVVVFDYTVRKASQKKQPDSQVRKIHIDQSPKGALGRVARHLEFGESAQILYGGRRFRIINVWKPISGPVMDHPLTFANCQSLRETDLIPVKQVYPDYVGETYAVKHGDHQEYWYWSRMTATDVLLLQCFDSRRSATIEKEGLVHTQCAHGSFELDETGNETFDRSSIEVRCLVLCETAG